MHLSFSLSHHVGTVKKIKTIEDKFKYEALGLRSFLLCIDHLYVLATSFFDAFPAIIATLVVSSGVVAVGALIYVVWKMYTIRLEGSTCKCMYC